MRHLDVRRLRYFIKIVEQGSFSKAAIALQVAQPALSLHVRNMELDIGKPLLIRSQQGVVPTECGMALLNKARTIVEQIDALAEEMKGTDEHPSGQVSLGLSGTISQVLAVPLMQEVHRIYPLIQLRIVEAMTGFFPDWLLQGRVDLAVLYNDPDDKKLASKHVQADELCLFGPTGGVHGPGQHLLFDASVVAYCDIATLPLLLPSRTHGLRRILEDEATRQQIVFVNVIEVDSYTSMIRMMEAGMGYAILPINAFDQHAHREGVRMWRIENPALTRSLYLVRSISGSRAVTAVERVCKETFFSLAQTGRCSAFPFTGSGLQTFIPSAVTQAL